MVWQNRRGMASPKMTARVGRLSEAEQRELLRSFDRVVPAIPTRPAVEVDAELAAVRRARRAGVRAEARNRTR